MGCCTYSHDPFFLPNLVYLLVPNAGQSEKFSFLSKRSGRDLDRQLTATVTYFISGIGIHNLETYDIVMCGVKTIELKNKRSRCQTGAEAQFLQCTDSNTS